MESVNDVRYKHRAVAEFLVYEKESVRKIHKCLKRLCRPYKGRNDLFDTSTLEEEVATIFRNVRNSVPSEMASYPRRRNPRIKYKLYTRPL